MFVNAFCEIKLETKICGNVILIKLDLVEEEEDEKQKFNLDFSGFFFCFNRNSSAGGENIFCFCFQFSFNCDKNCEIVFNFLVGQNVRFCNFPELIIFLLL